MKLQGLLLATVLVLSGTGRADITINEVRTDHPGGDINEYFEIFSDAGSEPLTGLTLVVLGDGAGGSGHVERAFDLSGLTASPFALIAIEDFAIPGAIPDARVPNGFFENSDNLTILLVNAFTGAEGDDLDTDDDGTLDVIPWTSVIDGLALVEDANRPPANTEYEYASVLGLPVVGPSQDNSGRDVPPGHVYRDVDGAGTWQIGLFDVFDFDADDTPSGTNAPVEEISLLLGDNQISEAGGSTSLTVSVDGSVTQDTPILLSFENFDASECIVPDVVIAAGTSSRIVTITAVDDAWRDFEQTVVIRAKAIGYFSASVALAVQDDETGDPAGLRVNEVHADPEDDANRDGTLNSGQDEFVEIVNDSASPIDLSGYELYDGSNLRHVFPVATTLDAGCAMVVFGGGDITEGQSLDFQGAILQKASSGTLALNNNGDIASLRTPAGTEIAGHVWGPIPDGNGSLTMSPDLNASNDFVSHFIASGVSSSAGTRTDGTAFCAFAQLTLAVSPDTIVENAGSMAAVLTITRTGDTSVPLTVGLSADDSEISLPATADFAADVAQITVDIDAVDDTAADNDQVVTIIASAPGFVDGVATITVQDDGDVNTSTIVINEVDYDLVGADTTGEEFVEIYDGGVGGTSLDGYEIVFYNGNDGSVYRRISLDGISTNAGGFYAAFTPPNGIQNGAPDGLALLNGAVLVDSLVYEAGDNPVLDGLGYAGPDLADSNVDNVSLSRVPDGTGDFQLAVPSPGASNGGSGGSDYATWAAGFPGIGTSADDDDCDGLVNLLEYALGKNPLAPDRDGIPSGMMVAGQMQLTVAKGSEAGADATLSYSVEVSTDLNAWSTAETSVLVSNATVLTVAYTGTAPRVYLRLRVVVQ